MPKSSSTYLSEKQESFLCDKFLQLFLFSSSPCACRRRRRRRRLGLCPRGIFLLAAPAISGKGGAGGKPFEIVELAAKLQLNLGAGYTTTTTTTTVVFLTKQKRLAASSNNQSGKIASAAVVSLIGL